jgi:hypothetical protein
MVKITRFIRDFAGLQEAFPLLQGIETKSPWRCADHRGSVRPSRAHCVWCVASRSSPATLPARPERARHRPRRKTQGAALAGSGMPALTPLAGWQCTSTIAPGAGRGTQTGGAWPLGAEASACPRLIAIVYCGRYGMIAVMQG